MSQRNHSRFTARPTAARPQVRKKPDAANPLKARSADADWSEVDPFDSSKLAGLVFLDQLFQECGGKLTPQDETGLRAAIRRRFDMVCAVLFRDYGRTGKDVQDGAYPKY